ncbi:MAG: UvrD-helicase domain-containing protein [Bacteroidales bacterium]|nr:UvrD-helicase domain-containing protein [Bacteroidales bacterium]
MLEIMKASAGSGKTYRLARKYISLLLESNDRYAYRHILAVTFTNKATDEMKSRILKELHILSVDPCRSDYHDHFVPSVFASDEDLGRKAGMVLSDILHDYSAFAVSTIDKFFQQTLKAFSREIGQFASYQVELDKDSLVAESVDRILDSLTEDDSNLLAWLTDNVLEQIEQGGRYSMDANLLEMAKRLKSAQRQEAMTQAGLKDDMDYPKDKLLEIRQICRKIVKDFSEAVKSAADAALSIVEETGVDPAESNRGFLKALYAYSELEEGDRIEMPSAAFMSKASDHEQWFAKSKAAKLKPLVYPFLEAPLEEFCALFDKEFKVYNTALILDGQLYGLGVSGALSRTFKEIMKEKNVLCIDDSNTILRDIIDGSDAPFVYEKLGVRYEHFLLDEFQDTANVQWSNFSPLLRESNSKGGDNLIVGDVKQSIYRWRGSDWKLLNDTVPGEFPEHHEDVLDTNYRSLFNIVKFNNLFFKSAALVLDMMNGLKNCGPISEIYSDVCQNVGKKSEEKGSVSVTFCPKEEELQKVLEAVEEARSNGAGLSDIAVLVRSNASGEDVAMYLIDNGIPVMTDDSLRVKSSMTVRRLVSLMSYADNPQDTVSGYLAQSLDITVPQGCSSLTDMAESFFRSLKAKDSEEIWKGEILHIQSFFDHVQDYVASNGNSLRGFLKYWEDEDPSISSPSSGDSVRVMTIHKSKGLDFPYVIIPFAENITLYKAGNYWCVPELSDTPLSGVADGVYDVTLSKSSDNTLFAEDYRKENFLQQVDNINTIYVAMTRAALGMHIIAKTPSAKCMKALESGDLTQISDFSQMLYWFANTSCGGDVPGNEELVPPFKVTRSVSDDGTERFDVGTMTDFGLHRKEDKNAYGTFEIGDADGLPSVPLNPDTSDPDVDVRERGRLKFTADALDFFSDEGEAGMAASNRIKGVVLHDILSGVTVPEDLESAVRQSVLNGDVTVSEADEAMKLLSERIAGAVSRGWFPHDSGRILNEATLIDTDGAMYRPDRVVISDGKVTIVDYKFGEHYRKYERQLKNYASIWHRMGYDDVSAFLWYVHTDEVVEVDV